MNKKSTIMTLVMLLSVSAAGLVLLDYYEQRVQFEPAEPGGLEETNSKSPEEQTNDSCENFTGIEKAKCYIGKGDLNASLEVCENLSENERDECYGRVAIRYALNNSANDVITCGRIHDSDTQTFCYSNIAAINVKNNLTRAKEICNKSEPAELCYSAVARVFARENLSKSIDICGSIDDANECYISLASGYMNESMSTAIEICGNVTACREMLAPIAAGSDPDTGVRLCADYPCIMGVAQVVAQNDTTKAIEICKTIGHPVPRSQCEYFILPQVLENQPRMLDELCGDIIPAWDNVQQLAPYCNITK